MPLGPTAVNGSHIGRPQGPKKRCKILLGPNRVIHIGYIM